MDAIVVQGLGKRFHRHGADRHRTIQEAVLYGFRGRGAGKFFNALEEVSFSVAQGKMVGMIGRNGAGKSTLLRLIGGVGKPDRGSIHIVGQVGALIDLGAGFHPDLTGRENVYINGVISGLTHRQVQNRFDEIVQFAELEKFIDSPLRTYSTGMQMRLAFAIAAHVNPDILLIDEVLAVGDLAFQRKCLERITDFKNQGCAILLVSHDTSMIGQLCDEALWLETGKLMAKGPATLVVDQYIDSMRAATQRRTPSQPAERVLPGGTMLRINENRFGSQEIEITSVRLVDESGYPITVIHTGAPICIEIEYDAPRQIEAPIFGVTLRREEGMVVCDISTSSILPILSEVQGKGTVSLQIQRLDLNGGMYSIDIGVYQKDWEYAYDYHWGAYTLTVEASSGKKGVLLPPHRWQHSSSQ